MIDKMGQRQRAKLGTSWKMLTCRGENMARVLWETHDGANPKGCRLNYFKDMDALRCRRMDIMERWSSPRAKKD